MGASDNNELYFCGSTDKNNGDYFFGMIDSTFVITALYRYGSPENEVFGDCALTRDNSHLIGIFATNFNKPRDTTVTKPNAYYVDTTYTNKDLGNPFTNCAAISTSTHTNMGKGKGGGSTASGLREVDGYLGEVSCDVVDVNKLIASVSPPNYSTSDYC